MSYKAVENFGVNIPLDYGEEIKFWVENQSRTLSSTFKSSRP